MGRKKFSKKDLVRFTLVNGVDSKGNPKVLYKPANSKSSSLDERQKQKIVNQIADMDIEINGKPVKQSQIPQFILEQIRGRADLIYNQNHQQMMENYDEGDLYEDQMIDGQQQQWEAQDQQLMIENVTEHVLNNKKQEQQQLKQVQIDGQKVVLTAKQAELLNVVLPSDYEKYQIDGVQFIKYDEDGNRLDQKKVYQKYLADPQQKRAIVDAYEFVPDKIADMYDIDLKNQQLKGDMKDLNDALNYQGPEQDYQQLEDDFFSSLLKNQNPKKPQKKKQKQPNIQSFKKKTTSTIIVPAQQQQNSVKKQEKMQKKQQFISKYDDIDDDQDFQDIEQEEQNYEDEEQITDQMLEKAIQHFDNHYLPQKKQKKVNKIEDQQQEQFIFRKPQGISLIQYLQSKQQFRGKDGQLDWRVLTKDQKKQYMKTKKIRDFFEEVRQRQIQEKMKNIKNVKPEQLHLKQYVKDIPFNEDHVYHEALQRDANQVVNMEVDSEQEYETESSQDDIISYKAKTSIISSNLATVQQQSKKKNKNNKKQAQIPISQQNSILKQRIKVVPQKRNKNQTKQERKARKQKLKEMKKMKKQQKKQFNELFDKQRKNIMKNQRKTQGNALYKVSHVKII